MDTYRDIFPISEEEIREIQKLCHTNPEKIKEDVETLKEWLAEQPHLPKKPPSCFTVDEVIERALCQCFYRVDITKKRAELHFTQKAKNKDFFEIFGSERFILPSQNSLIFLPLPKLGPDYDRIYVGRLRSTNVDDFEFDHGLQMAMAAVELGFKYERTNRSTCVIDCEGFGASYLKKIDFSRFIRLITFFYEGYFTRIMGVHVINANSAIQFLINISKKIIAAKMMKKLHVHENLESLHEMIETKYLPEEFGGTNSSIAEILGKMDPFVLENREFMVESAQFVADESKRPGNEYNGATFGVDVFF